MPPFALPRYQYTVLVPFVHDVSSDETYNATLLDVFDATLIPAKVSPP
jgi:hypothetical protein